MLNTHYEELDRNDLLSPDSVKSTTAQQISRRRFISASAAALAIGGCKRPMNAEDTRSTEHVTALNNLIADSGWKCVQMKGYLAIAFVYNNKEEYARTIHTHPNGPFIIYNNSQKDSSVASGTTSIETWESDSIEKFSTIEELAAYIIRLSKSESK